MEDEDRVLQEQTAKNQLRKLFIRDDDATQQQRLDQRARELDDLLHLHDQEAKQQQERLSERERNVEELREKLRVEQYVREKKAAEGD